MATTVTSVRVPRELNARLERHPRIGRRVDAWRRELVIEHGATGYLAPQFIELRVCGSAG